MHEAWLKLCERDDLQWQSRLHFLRVATAAMRSILVDHAREQATAKRGGSVLRVSLDDVGAGADTAAETILALDESLVRLREVDDELAMTAELKLFSALSMDEIAAALGSSKRTAARAWSLARAWLQRDLAGN